MQKLSIGAVAQLTQIPAHTLRKWESRHGIATPIRSDTGRRVYTQDHVEQLKLVKSLLADGHSLAHLAGLDTAQLHELAGMHEQSPQRTPISSLTLVGPNVARLLYPSPLVRVRALSDFATWMASAMQPETEGLIIECETLPPATSTHYFY